MPVHKIGSNSDWQPDVIKLDMFLTRYIKKDKIKHSLILGIIFICKQLGIIIIAESIETKDEHLTLADIGIILFQGFKLAHSGFELFAVVSDYI